MARPLRWWIRALHMRKAGENRGGVGPSQPSHCELGRRGICVLTNEPGRNHLSSYHLGYDLVLFDSNSSAWCSCGAAGIHYDLEQQ